MSQTKEEEPPRTVKPQRELSKTQLKEIEKRPGHKTKQLASFFHVIIEGIVEEGQYDDIFENYGFDDKTWQFDLEGKKFQIALISSDSQMIISPETYKSQNTLQQEEWAQMEEEERVKDLPPVQNAIVDNIVTIQEKETSVVPNQGACSCFPLPVPVPNDH